MFSIVREDIRRWLRPNSKIYDLIMSFLRCPALWLVLSYRFGRWLKSIPIVNILGLIWSQIVHFPLMILSGIELPLRSEFGPGLRIHHFGGVVIHPNVKAGNNITLFQGVTIGENYEQRSVPILGSDITIMPHAVLAGNIRIGDGVVIGANSVVTKDIPARCMVAGIPAEIIRSRI